MLGAKETNVYIIRMVSYMCNFCDQNQWIKPEKVVI